VFFRQNPAAIDAGAFHNDVVAVGNLNLMLLHRSAFTDHDPAIDQLRRAYAATCGGELTIIEADESQLPLADAISSYLFNSQLVRLPDGRTAMIAPVECHENPRVCLFLNEITAISARHFADVRQSMRNGGGPACLRLRVALTEAELARVHPGVILTPALYERLEMWIGKHYRDRLTPDDLADVKLLEECRTALDELTRILGIRAVYRFQQP
jgi:succinylarginine dihydrolase